MKIRFYIFVFSIVLFSCWDSPNTGSSTKMIVGDSISFYLNLALEQSKSLKDKMVAVNKAMDLSNEKDSLFLKIVSQKSFLHFSLKEYDSLVLFSNLMFKHSSSDINDRYLGKQHHLLGYYFDEISNIQDSAFYHYNISKGYFKNDSSQIGRRLMSMALIQKNQNDFFGSKETATEALEYLDSQKDQKFITSIYNILATNHRKLLNFPDAINYYNKAIESSISDKDKLICKNNLAATYIDYQHYEKAISLLSSISKDSILTGNKKEYARVLDNQAYANWLSGIPVEVNDFQEPLKIRIENKDQRGQVASYTRLGEYYKKDSPKRAQAYFDKGIQLCKSLKIPRGEKDILKQLMSLELNNVKIRNRYVFLQDSLYENELKVKTQFAKYKYDDKLKQEDILRLEKENAEQELKVAKQRNQKILTYAIGVPALLLLGFLTYSFVQRSKRLKQQNKTAKLEATYETEAELSKKLHDDFGGKLNHAMLLLQSEANSEEVLNIVDGLYNQSRDFSREINDVDTGPSFKNLLFGMMGNYSKNIKLVVTGSTDIDWLRISTLSKKTLFKVLQELMINMQKHSNANLVSVVFEETKKMLKVTYADDGVGASSEELNLKNGLWNTEKRIEAIGGTIIFDSDKGSGFGVQIEIPN